MIPDIFIIWDRVFNTIHPEYKNQYEYEIELWLSDNELDCSEDDAIEHIMSVRKKLINELDYNNSVADLTRLEVIKGIEDKYIIPTIKVLIENNVPTNFNPEVYPIPALLNNFKPFQPISPKTKSKGKGGRPKGKSLKTIQRYNWIRDKYIILKDKRSGSTLEEFAGLIYSELREKAPSYFGKPYKKSTILKVLKNKSWTEE